MLHLEIMPLYGGAGPFNAADDQVITRLFVAWAGRRAAHYEEKRLEREWWAKLFGAEISAAPAPKKAKKS